MAIGVAAVVFALAGGAVVDSGVFGQLLAVVANGLPVAVFVLGIGTIADAVTPARLRHLCHHGQSTPTGLLRSWVAGVGVIAATVGA